MDKEMNLAESLAIEEFKTANIVVGNHKFDYERYEEPKLHILRETYNLDSVVQGATSEFEKFLLLRNWLAEWQYGREWPARHPFDALVILERMKKEDGHTGGSCGAFGMAFVQCLLSLGFQARLLAIWERTCVSGHIVTEVWSNEYQKWVLMDPDYNMHYEKDGIPLSALELHNAWINNEWESVDAIKGTPRPKGYDVDKPPIQHKLLDYYYHFRVTMRNDHFSNLHGDDFYPMLHWIDEKTPPLMIFDNGICNDRNSGRVEDFYWTLNQVAVDIHHFNDCYNEISSIPVDFSFLKLMDYFNKHKRYVTMDEIPIHLDEKRLRLLKVELETVTPHFENFLVRIDSGGFEPKPASFIWELHKGENLLEAKTRNKFGIEGPLSKARIKYLG